MNNHFMVSQENNIITTENVTAEDIPIISIPKLYFRCNLDGDYCD